MALRTGLDYTAAMKYLVILFLLFIIYSLGAAAYFMLKDNGNSERMVRALTVRVALSVTLFLLLMAGIHFGFITGKL
ncbi:MAG TPA: twin transmembrane helix small protein [Burkholderiales bacterium]|nr:twin transmembrane helix small protein [Burkholderiales bacterium]